MVGTSLLPRPDVLPPDVMGELAKLQDRIEPFPTDQVRRTNTPYLGPSWCVVHCICDVPATGFTRCDAFAGGRFPSRLRLWWSRSWAPPQEPIITRTHRADCTRTSERIE